MRHLSPCRLPLASHDPTTSILRGVRPVSSPASSAPAADTVPWTLSHTVTLPVHADLFTRLSRRQLRQREQRWGALWRYRPDAVPLSSPRPTPSPPMLPLGEETKTDRAAATTSLGPAPSLSSTTKPVPLQVDVGGSGAVGSGVRFEVHTAEAAASASVRAPHAATLESASEAQQDDPLLAFLNNNGEDAAELLAMWTSLHRSCVYASELSESVVLQVRHVLHSLLRNRAIAAAVEFYHRLMGLGVQLQQSDVLLLFASLPYEQAATTEAEQMRRAQEGAAMEKDRRLWAKRRAEFRQHAAQHHHHHQQEGKRTAQGEGVERRTEPGPSSTVMVEQHLAESRLSQPSTSTAAVHEAMREEAHPPRAIAHRVAFAQQPEWVKRWILYEASMGTLDNLDTPEEAATTASLRQGESGSSVHGNAGDSAWTFGPTAAEATLQSERASRAMEVAAIVDHLRLLTLGAMQRDRHTARPPTQRRRIRRKSHLAAAGATRTAGVVEQLHWREALRVVRNAFADPLWWSPQPPAAASSAAEVESTVVLPDDVAATLQLMMRDASTWEGALAALRLTASPTLQLNGAQARQRCAPPEQMVMSNSAFADGAVLFTALAATAQPWKSQASVEEWMNQTMLPRLAATAAAAAAAAASPVSSAAVSSIFALWLSHLCGVKAGRPEAFIAMAGEVAAYLPPSSPAAPTAADLLLFHSDLAVLVADVEARSLRAVDALRVSVHEAFLSRRAAQALATSIRSGAYRPHAESDMVVEEEAHDGTGYADLKSSLTPTPSSKEFACAVTGAALLTDRQVDAFVLCCAAVKETVWLRLTTTTASQSRAAVTVEVLQFLEKSLYGDDGLHALYGSLYSSASTSRRAPAGKSAGSVSSFAHLSPTTSTAAAAAAAPERPFVAVVMAITLLEVAQLLCSPVTHRHGFGSHLSHRHTVSLLVELARRAAEAVQPSHISTAPWRWAVEARVTELIGATARTLHAVVRDLDLQPRNEKAMFGALPAQDLQLLAELARLIIKTSDLATTTASKGRPLQCPVWRLLTSTASPQMLWGVQLCFRGSGALGRQVRHHLSSNEAQRLDAILSTLRSRPRRVSQGMATASFSSSSSSRVQRLDVGLFPKKATTDVDFQSARATHDAVYAAVRQQATTVGVREALQDIAAASPSWRVSLQLCHAVTRDVALARGTCDMNFFTTVLKGATNHLAEEHAVSRAAAANRDHGRGHRGGDVRARGTVGPPSLWLNAIDVFWSALDHTAGTAVSPIEGAMAPTVAKPMAAVEVQERAVLAHLLLPLMEFSRTVQRVDVGRQWRRTWANKYSDSERQTAQFCRHNIAALAALGDGAALEQCVTNYALLGHDEALLCSVAAQHRTWQYAFDTLMRTFGSIEEKGAAQQHPACYSLTVARTLLGLLARSEKNMSNTAMRLEALQGEVWDGDCSAHVVRLLVRARRWSLALRHVEAALGRQPTLQQLHTRMVSSVNTTATPTAAALGQEVDGATFSGLPPTSPPPTPQEALPYVRLLTLALQATAIGGDAATAPRYYDALKRTIAAVFGTSADTLPAEGSSLSASGLGAAPDSGLEAAFAMATAVTLVAHPAAAATGGGEVHAPSAEEVRCRAELTDLASRARLFFFRAMTKKMMSGKSSAAAAHAHVPMNTEAEGDEEEDVLVAAGSSDFWDDAEAEGGGDGTSTR